SFWALCPRVRNARGVCHTTLLVRVRFGGGAATADLVTGHQEGERERRSNQTVRLRGLRPDVPVQSMRYIRKEHQKGSPLCGLVRPRAPSLPSTVTRRQSAAGQTLGAV